MTHCSHHEATTLTTTATVTGQAPVTILREDCFTTRSSITGKWFFSDHEAYGCSKR
ncbi:hypothetical protein SESBI_44674 [Sesbania bispinosa]|nr:hypothetical protein SESBI_44674 [Sesbania bispinosa]